MRAPFTSALAIAALVAGCFAEGAVLPLAPTGQDLHADSGRKSHTAAVCVVSPSRGGLGVVQPQIAQDRAMPASGFGPGFCAGPQRFDPGRALVPARGDRRLRIGCPPQGPPSLAS